MGIEKILFRCLLLSVVLATEAFPAYDAKISYMEALNMAGRQRMLTQRITKSYCQIGLDVLPEQSRQQLEEAIRLFEVQLQSLKVFSPDDEITKALERVESRWTEFQKLARSAPSRSDIRRLTEMDELILQESERVVQLLEDRSGRAVSSYVNISGRQRMLSQRLAKFYMLQSWEQRTPSMITEMERAINEFSGALNALVQADENTIAIREKLEEARVQWMWLNSSLKFNQGEYYPVIVFDSSEKMLQIMERLTEMYQMVAEQY